MLIYLVIIKYHGHAQNQQKYSYQRNIFHKKIHFDVCVEIYQSNIYVQYIKYSIYHASFFSKKLSGNTNK